MRPFRSYINDDERVKRGRRSAWERPFRGWFAAAATALALALTALPAAVGSAEQSPPPSAGAAASEPTAAASSCRGSGASPRNLNKARRAILCLVNAARARDGVRPLRSNSKLNRSAARKAADIVRCNSFSHEACGREFTYWIERVGYKRGGCWSAAENIAYGTGRLGTAGRIFRSWMNSPPHRSAILSARYRDLGIGATSGSLSGASGARVWVQHFGSHC